MQDTTKPPPGDEGIHLHDYGAIHGVGHHNYLDTVSGCLAPSPSTKTLDKGTGVSHFKGFLRQSFWKGCST